MKELISKPELFNYGKLGKIRGLVVNKEPWFVAKDLCDALEIKGSTSRALESLDEDEKGVHKVYTPGGNQNLWNS